MRSSSTSLWLPVALLLVAMISFNAGAAFAKQLLPSLGAMGTATLRLSFASIMLCLIFRPWSPRPSSKSLRMIAVHGLTIGMMNVLFYLALLRVPLGVAVALEFMGPLAVAVSSSRKKLDYLWVGLAVIGVLILLPRTDTNGALPLQGIIYALGAACCWAMYIIIGKKAGATAASGTAASIGMLAGALAIMPFGLATSGLALLDTQFWPSADLPPGREPISKLGLSLSQRQPASLAEA